MNYTMKETFLKGTFETLNIIKLNINIPIRTKVLYVIIEATAHRINAISFEAPLSL